MSAAPWAADLMREHFDNLVAAVMTTIEAGERAGALDEPTRNNLLSVARNAIGCFIMRLGDPDAALDTEAFRNYGRVQFASGRSLEEMLWFYRVGANATWQYAAEHPQRGELPAETVLTFGRLLLELVDEISRAAVEGFVSEQTSSLRQEIVKREQLHILLLSDPPCPTDVVATAATAARWELPRKLRVAVAAMPIEPPAGFQLAAPTRVLSGPLEGGRRSLIVADDTEAETWIVRAAQAMSLPMPIALGPAVEPRHAARSAERAGSLLELIETGVIPPDGDIVRSDEHEIELLIACAPDLAESLSERRLQPLSTITGSQRERMVETLEAWLADPGRPQAMADRLNVHVQTVRYRLRILRELFGPDLDDPDARFELAVALRSLSSLRQR